jgi:predicted transcriptional regulator
MIRKTSKQAYKQTSALRVTQAEMVLNIIKKKGNASINDIARELNLVPGRVSARVNKLYKDKKIRESQWVKTDPITNKPCKCYVLIDGVCWIAQYDAWDGFSIYSIGNVNNIVTHYSKI